ncbi:MAG TPA: serine protease [Polyangiaceae bacterium]|nr:serine protease [Polyangiaceae bacterium]
MRRALPLSVLVASTLGLGCSNVKSPHPSAEVVFDAVAPSVVAIVNDDTQDREEETRELERMMGKEPHAPKHVIDVSLRKEMSPQGTGFAIRASEVPGGQGDGVLIVTAAHVVQRPDRLKIRTRQGQTADAELFRIDEVRDVAVLKPKTPLAGVTPLKLEEHDLAVGEPVWALGHTGRGYWSLSWGMSEGIASGIVDMMGNKLLLFDAAVYPGFSGGPVVTFHDHGRAEVAGVNHAILFTGGEERSAASIFSAVAVSELHEVLGGRRAPLEKTLAKYANEQRQKTYADLFITSRFQLTTDENGRPNAHMMGDARSVDIDDDGNVDVPCVAMLFGFPPGEADVRFEARNPKGETVATTKASTKLEDKQRVGFASANLGFSAKTPGSYNIVALKDGKEIGRAVVAVEDQDEDESLHEHDPDVADDGNPDVDVVVARVTNSSPLVLAGIRSFWTERSYPRRVDFSWFARGTRGWQGRDVIVSAYVLDQNGQVVGESDGCYWPELRPENTWACIGNGGMMPPPLAAKAGSYDIVFTVNERPVAWWPMEATLRKDSPSSSEMDRWMQDMRRVVVPPPHKHGH